MPAVLIFIRLMDVVFRLDDVAFLVNWATRLTSSVGRNAVGIVNKVVLSAMVEEAVLYPIPMDIKTSFPIFLR